MINVYNMKVIVIPYPNRPPTFAPRILPAPSSWTKPSRLLTLTGLPVIAEVRSGLLIVARICSFVRLGGL